MKRILPLLVLIAACAPTTSDPAAMPSPDGPDPATPTAEAPAAEAPSAENAADRHREVLWVRTAAEYRALALQVYRSAWQAVRGHADNLAAGTWAVIMDADETVLDNSEFERRIAEAGVEFEESMWDEWVFEEDAGLVPGAARFIDQVRDMGGRIAIVTNRDERLCPATRRNLAALGIRPAVVLCETETGEKEPRFRMVEEGTASDTLPPLEVVAWVGDNIGDFPGFDQSARTDVLSTFRLFGSRYFVLPNPMYGSWMGNEWR
ncbi:MAG: 5'-nucleotidase, lipoprotein e(P4) family [Candidatus Longimicrobiales bacterium M2_2A_002]